VANERHGGRVLADQLNIHGCKRVFLVPGESFLPVLDGLYDHPHIDIVSCRQEGGAAMMAEAHGKISASPGVCMVTRGPGATNASAGVHIARQDSTPMLLLVGQVPREYRGREAFQEVDLVSMFGALAKWATDVDTPARLPEVIGRAYHTAINGRPGPVVVSLPEDMLYETVAVPDATAVQPSPVTCSNEDAETALAMLSEAQRPLVVAGGTPWGDDAYHALATFSERCGVPVLSSFRRQDYLHNEHENYAGCLSVAIDPRLSARVQQADLIIALGTRLSEITTGGYTLLNPPVAQQKLIHVHVDPAELGKVYTPALAINASAVSFLDAINQLTFTPPSDWQAWTQEARKEYLTYRKPLPMPGKCQIGDIVEHLNRTLTDDAIVANGAGNYTAWVHRHTRFRGFPTQLAPTSGSMGYGLPAAIAAKLHYPHRQVICWAGDGCYLMHGQELATAVQYGASIIVLVVNNNMYGTIRMHQERNFPDRVIGTELRNPDFVALARSYGAFGACLTDSSDFAAVFDEASQCGKPALIELQVDPDACTPGKALHEIRG